ncbi:MAG TPA: hypothetical protein EYP21_06990 [Syntrophaceae bacterium]|nr:hypothetical protein [Syntrophaceae bacterium]
MKTLLEYLTFVKGVGYLLIVVYLFGFLAFWHLIQSTKYLIHANKVKRIMSVAVPLVLMMFGGIAVIAFVTNGNHSGVATPTTSESTFGVNTSEYLPLAYVSAKHLHEVMKTEVSCETCHHNSNGEIHACKDCHGVPFDPHNLSKPGLKAAIHERCMYCHKEVFGGPESCKLCHTQGLPSTALAINAPARPHELMWEDCNKCHKKGIYQNIKIVYHDNCLMCHLKGIAGAAKIPPDHTDYTNNVNLCQGCHKPASGGAKA